jgi:hypothetical protein
LFIDYQGVSFQAAYKIYISSEIVMGEKREIKKEKKKPAEKNLKEKRKEKKEKKKGNQ